MSDLPSLGPKETAAILRRVLKERFPMVRFSIVTERGSMVSSVRVSWTDGPTTSAVESVACLFEAGHFDGMTDSYTYDQAAYLTLEGVPMRPGCRYVFCNRTISDRERDRIASVLLGSKQVPPRASWDKAKYRGNGGGYVSFADAVYQAAANRESFDRAKFDAHAWLDAFTLGVSELPRSTNYDRVAVQSEGSR